ncbi:MAG: cytochrome P450 [Saprospiraceae bacterium]|nr:cytochrome P450 [Saprospiraceae bacterium]
MQNKTSKAEQVKDMPVLPRASWWLIIKNVLSMLSNPLEYLTEWFEEYGDIYDLNSRFFTVFVISNPQYIQEIMVANKKDYGKSEHYKVLKNSLGNGLLISEGAFWKKQRRIAQPAFHHQSMKNFLHTMISATQTTIERMKGVQTVDISREMNFLTLEIVTKCLFGTTLDADVNKIQEAITIGNKFISDRARSLLKLPLWLPTPNILRYKRARKFSDKVIFNIIDKRKDDESEHFDLLSMLMHTVDEETGESMSAQQLRDESITLFVAGQETTATALSWTFYLLMKNPEKLERLKQEVEQVLKGKSPDFETLKDLKYTQMVLEESMRIYPPAWVITRKVLNDTDMCGYKMNKDAQLILNVYSLHRHSDHWEEPELFKPERFNSELKKSRHKYAYIPFGAGQRMCIGNNFAMMEMKIALTMLVQNFEFSLPENVPDLEMEPLVTLRPKGGVKLNVKPIKC